MAIGFKHGSSGGDPLNFTVVNASSQPTDPKENMIWINTTWAQNGWSFGADMPLRHTKSSNDNFIVYPFYESTHTESGITFTDNGDGSITANGTATADSNFRFSYTSAESGMFLLTPGTYTLSGCPSGGSTSTYYLLLNRIDSGVWSQYMTDTGNGNDFTVDRDTVCNVTFRVSKGTKVENLTVKPMLNKGSSALSFVKGNANGQVWIKPNDANSISFEALKKNSKNNGIVLHPGEVYMYNQSGGWNKQRQTNCKIYQNGAWVNLWDGYYFKAGDQCTDITGGWTAAGWTSSAWSVTQQSKVNADNLYVLGQTSSMSAVGTVKKVNLYGISTLKASINQTAGTVTMCISESNNHSDSVASKANTTTGSREISLDVSGYNGSYYIIIFAHGAGSEATITNVWGE